LNKKHKIFGWLTGLVLLLTGQAYSQTLLNFPRILSSSERFTGIALNNPTSETATVTLTAYTPNGERLSGANIQNPVTVRLSSASQYARLFGEIFGTNIPFDGWVQATSASSGLTGFVLTGSTTIADFDGSIAAAPLTRSWLPLISVEGNAANEITIVNINDEPTSATVNLYSPDGNSISARQIDLPSHGLYRKTVQETFASTAGATHLGIRSFLPVSAYEVVSGFQSPAQSIARESIAFAAQAGVGVSSEILPQFVTGGDWLSILGVVNTGGLEQDLTITLHDDDGSILNIPGNPKQIRLAGRGALRSSIADLFGYSPAELKTGWVDLKSSSGNLISYISYGNLATPSFAMVAGTNSLTASRNHVYSHIAEGAGYYTGLTLVNPNDTPASVELSVMRADGVTVGTASLTVPPGARIGRLFRELLPASLTQIGGWALVRSSLPISGAVLFGSVDGSALASVPQQEGVDTFKTPPQTVAAITGSVQFTDGSPVPNVLVTLGGSVRTTTRTDAGGKFIFSQLPSGAYDVAVSDPAWEMSPVRRSVTITSSNIDRTDFQALRIRPRSAPVIDGITPTQAQTGSGPLQIAVVGQNFSTDSQVVMNGVALRTSFVGEHRLSAAVPLGLTTQQGAVSVTVVTPAPGGGQSNEVALTFDFAAAAPTVFLGTAPGGSSPAGVAIDSRRRTALVSNETSDTVSVVDLKTYKTITEIRVGRSPSEGIAIEPARNIALVANTGTDDVSVIDLNSNAVIRTIPVGLFPMGIAINGAADRAYVVNGNSDTVSVIDLNTLLVIRTLNVGAKPGAIAVNSATNQAVVTNPGSASATVIDLANLTVLGSIPVGAFPRGVAINPETNRAVVANANSSACNTYVFH